MTLGRNGTPVLSIANKKKLNKFRKRRGRIHAVVDLSAEVHIIGLDRGCYGGNLRLKAVSGTLIVN